MDLSKKKEKDEIFSRRFAELQKNSEIKAANLTQQRLHSDFGSNRPAYYGWEEELVEQQERFHPGQVQIQTKKLPPIPNNKGKQPQDANSRMESTAPGDYEYASTSNAEKRHSRTEIFTAEDYDDLEDRLHQTEVSFSGSDEVTNSYPTQRSDSMYKKPILSEALNKKISDSIVQLKTRNELSVPPPPPLPLNNQRSDVAPSKRMSTNTNPFLVESDMKMNQQSRGNTQGFEDNFSSNGFDQKPSNVNNSFSNQQQPNQYFNANGQFPPNSYNQQYNPPMQQTPYPYYNYNPNMNMGMGPMNNMYGPPNVSMQNMPPNYGFYPQQSMTPYGSFPPQPNYQGFNTDFNTQAQVPPTPPVNTVKSVSATTTVASSDPFDPFDFADFEAANKNNAIANVDKSPKKVTTTTSVSSSTERTRSPPETIVVEKIQYVPQKKSKEEEQLEKDFEMAMRLQEEEVRDAVTNLRGQQRGGNNRSLPTHSHRRTPSPPRSMVSQRRPSNPSVSSLRSNSPEYQYPDFNPHMHEDEYDFQPHSSAHSAHSNLNNPDRRAFLLSVEELRLTSVRVVDRAIRNVYRRAEVNLPKRRKVIDIVYEGMLFAGTLGYRFRTMSQYARFIDQVSQLIQPAFKRSTSSVNHVSIDIHEVLFGTYVKAECLKKEHIQAGVQGILRAL